MVSVAITEHDLQRKAHNPFVGLEIVKADSAPDNEWDKRDPFPREIILAGARCLVPASDGLDRI